MLGGLGCLGGAEQELVDVGQALADLQGDVDPGLGCCCGQAFGIAEQQVGRADLDEQRRDVGISFGMGWPRTKALAAAVRAPPAGVTGVR